jgi:hypothetical protein
MYRRLTGTGFPLLRWHEAFLILFVIYLRITMGVFKETFGGWYRALSRIWNYRWRRVNVRQVSLFLIWNVLSYHLITAPSLQTNQRMASKWAASHMHLQHYLEAPHSTRDQRGKHSYHLLPPITHRRLYMKPHIVTGTSIYTLPPWR